MFLDCKVEVVIRGNGKDNFGNIEHWTAHVARGLNSPKQPIMSGIGIVPTYIRVVHVVAK